jgi:hypothetical protein
MTYEGFITGLFCRVDDQMLVETVLSMLTVVSHARKMRHRLAGYFHAHARWMAAAFNLLIGWHALQPNARINAARRAMSRR